MKWVLKILTPTNLIGRQDVNLPLICLKTYSLFSNNAIIKINNDCRKLIIMFERVTKRESRIARERVAAIILKIQKILRDKYTFTYRLVGSAKWGTIIKDDSGKYDLDYQLLLTSKSKEFKANKLSNPTMIKNDFYGAFSKALDQSERIENSTTAITLYNNSKPFSVDFVIIKLFPENNQIIRRNNKSKSSVNECTWNELPRMSEAYKKFRKLKPDVKQYLIEKIIIPKKCIEKSKNDNDFTKISSSELFVREVNNYCDNKRKDC